MLPLEAAMSGPPVLRDYQQECVDALVDYRVQGGKRALFTMSTGSGKTTCFASLARCQKRMLVLAHREELLDQAADRIALMNPGISVGIEQADRHAKRDDKVVIGSVQSLVQPRRLTRLVPEDFSVVVVDESHRIAAPTYLSILAHFGLAPLTSDLAERDLTRADANSIVAQRFRSFVPPDTAPYLVGCTATPNRSDNQGLEFIFDSVVYTFTIRDGIERGWLSPLRGYKIATASDISGVGSRGGEFIDGQLSNAVNNEQRNELIAQSYLEHCGLPDGRYRQALVFCVDRAHAHAVHEVFERRGIASAVLLGDTPHAERVRTLRDFRTGQLQVLTSVAVLTEGIDLPEVSAILMARPCKSSLVYTQQLGRGCRIAEGKDDCLILDFVDAGKAGVQNLNTMFGLPPRLNLGTSDVLTVKREVEAYEDQVSQGRLMEATSLDQIEVMAHEFDPLVVSGLEDWVLRYAQMAWVKTSYGYALTLMGPDREAVGIVVDALGHAHVRARTERPGGPPSTEIGVFDGLGEAFGAAESWVEDRDAHMAHNLRRDAAWRLSKDPASDKQVKLLRRLRVPVIDGLTKGQASALIDATLQKQGRTLPPRQRGANGVRQDLVSENLARARRLNSAYAKEPW